MWSFFAVMLLPPLVSAGLQIQAAISWGAKSLLLIDFEISLSHIITQGSSKQKAKAECSTIIIKTVLIQVFKKLHSVRLNLVNRQILRPARPLQQTGVPSVAKRNLPSQQVVNTFNTKKVLGLSSTWVNFILTSHLNQILIF